MLHCFQRSLMHHPPDWVVGQGKRRKGVPPHIAVRVEWITSLFIQVRQNRRAFGLEQLFEQPIDAADGPQTQLWGYGVAAEPAGIAARRGIEEIGESLRNLALRKRLQRRGGVVA